MRVPKLFVVTFIPDSWSSSWKPIRTHMDALRRLWALFQQLNRNLTQALEITPGAVPWVEMLQRRYLNQRSEPVIDAALEFDLRTAFEPTSGLEKIKHQPQWLDAVYDTLSLAASAVPPTKAQIFSGVTLVRRIPERTTAKPRPASHGKITPGGAIIA